MNHEATILVELLCTNSQATYDEINISFSISSMGMLTQKEGTTFCDVFGVFKNMLPRSWEKLQHDTSYIMFALTRHKHPGNMERDLWLKDVVNRIGMVLSSDSWYLRWSCIHPGPSEPGLVWDFLFKLELACLSTKQL